MTKKQKCPATEAQELARERNWNKGQILCLRTIANNIYKAKTTKKNEKILLDDMKVMLNNILNNWTK